MIALKYFIPISVMTITAMFMSGYLTTNTLVSLGGVTQGNEYYSDQFTSADASTTAVTELKDGYGSLGSVVVTGQNTGASLVVYDATSTMATSTATVLGSFGASTYDTYTFDSIFTNGLSIEVPSDFDGVYTITWR